MGLRRARCAERRGLKTALTVDRLWLRIEFDRDEVERERGEAQCLLVDVEACDLVVEDLAQALGVGPLAVGAPSCCDEFTKGS